MTIEGARASLSPAMRALFLGCGALLVLVGACSDDTSSDYVNNEPSPSASTPVNRTDAGTKMSAEAGVDGATPDAETPPPQPVVYVNYTQETMTVNGQARTYWLGTPATLEPGKTYPVVMSFHGNPGSAQLSMEGERFDATSKGDAIIVYPQALWADGNGLFNWDHSVSAGNVDIPFVDALPGELAAKGLPVDATRIYGYGYSGGAFFMQSYQCLQGGKIFRAITSNAGGVPGGGGSTCSTCSTQTVPTLLIHGLADAETGNGNDEARCQAASSGCSSDLTDTAPAPCQLYGGCRSVVQRCSIQGLGHYPGWAEGVPTAWAFFGTH